MSDSRHFYRDLTPWRLGLANLLADVSTFRAVPADWSVVMLDVVDSTGAVAAGQHHEVNLAATGGIVAVMNVVHADTDELDVPFFFGGDGATFLLPPQVLDEVLDVLERYQRHIARTLGLTLKVGAHSVSGTYRRGHTIRLARLMVNDHLTLPIVLGTGVKFAERTMKHVLAIDEAEGPPNLPTVDLTGMECRWDEVAPPRDQHRVVCLLVDCPDGERQGAVYAGIARHIDGNFGAPEQRNPISGAKLKLDLAIAKTRQEMTVRLERFTFWALVKDWMMTLFGPVYFRLTKNGRAYLAQVVELSHTLMIDGTFNAVLTGTQAQIDALVRHLDAGEAAGDFTYGMHVTHAALMSCYVVDRSHEHAHFVDGTEGGFTSAARALKAKRG